ncbi:MAG: phenylalanine--tRNA ligase subunit beta [Clostridia bacterium]|nr:phenylalanine--tRNA ligase subunit beta [Clostridia bacterium]
MNLSMKWLADYCDIDVSAKEFCDAMTLSGSKVEGFEKEGEELKRIVVGRVEEIKKHENSDHLWVCQLNVGGDSNIQIVTGAQNVNQGDYVPVALDKSVVHGGHEIKKGKLRGEVSEGMLCSLGELGLSINDFPYAIEDGIFILGDDCDKTLGMDIREAIGFDDTVVEFEITSNRSDCLSVIGLAREAAVTFNKPLKVADKAALKEDGAVEDIIKISVADADLCYRYVGAVVKNVKIGPSPRWMRERLRASGVRSINNIVDITNYVMLEYGHPMHAFDLRYVEGNHITARRATKGEKIVTLDGGERELNENMLVIADDKKPIAVAGVMGGEFSSVMDDTETIVFEAACFNGASVRTTAKALGMRTESSARFEKELDPNNCMGAITRALELITILGAGEVVDGIIDVFPTPKAPSKVKFDYEWINNFIGINVPRDRQVSILEQLGFTFEGEMVVAPSFRNDIEHPADVAEEIARIYGYDKIESTPLSGVSNAKLTPKQAFVKNVNDALLAQGVSEIQTYSFVSPKVYDKIMLPENSPLRNCVVISNPLGEDTSVMRTTAIPSMLDIVSKNYNNRNLVASFFELATVYSSNGKEQLPTEKQKVVIGAYGEGVDFFEVKGIVEEVLRKMYVFNYDFTAISDRVEFHPGRTAEITVGDVKLGFMGEISPQVQENYGIGTRVYAAELDIDACFEVATPDVKFSPLPKFPAIVRDLSFVCDADIPVMSLQKRIAAAAGKYAESVNIFDIYQGKQIEKDKKSVAFKLVLRSNEKTLTDTEADDAMNRVVKSLAELSITLRS